MCSCNLAILLVLQHVDMYALIRTLSCNELVEGIPCNALDIVAMLRYIADLVASHSIPDPGNIVH